MEPFEKPDKMSLGTIVGPGLRVPVPPLRDVGRVVELACVSLFLSALEDRATEVRGSVVCQVLES